MKKLFFAFLTLFFFGCSGKINEQPIAAELKEKTLDSNLVVFNAEEPTEEIDDVEMELLIKKWNWNEEISPPLKSSISNPKFSSKLLFRTWTWCDEDGTEPAMTFEKDSLNIHEEEKYIYSINVDSLRIFTAYDQPGDGFTRGIITKLTKDSLIINWSTDPEDISKYVPLKKIKY